MSINKVLNKCQVSTLNLSNPKTKWDGAEEPRLIIPIKLIADYFDYVHKKSESGTMIPPAVAQPKWGPGK